jgi:endonuclease YncB( thermonuclease family)
MPARTGTIGLLAALLLVTPAAAMPLCCADPGPRVTCVADGDTLWLDRVNIWLAGIDAPELGRPAARPSPSSPRAPPSGWRRYALPASPGRIAR